MEALLRSIASTMKGLRDQLLARIVAIEARLAARERLKVEYDGRRTLTFLQSDGTPVEGGVLRLPIPIFEGPYVEGRKYEAGDEVQDGGHLWLAREDTATKPDELGAGPRPWVMVVRRGREGKQGPPGREARGEPR